MIAGGSPRGRWFRPDHSLGEVVLLADVRAGAPDRRRVGSAVRRLRGPGRSLRRTQPGRDAPALHKKRPCPHPHPGPGIRGGAHRAGRGRRALEVGGGDVVGQGDDLADQGGDLRRGSAPHAHEEVHGHRGQPRLAQDDHGAGSEGRPHLPALGERPVAGRAEVGAHTVRLGARQVLIQQAELSGVAALLGAVVMDDDQAQIDGEQPPLAVPDVQQPRQRGAALDASERDEEILQAGAPPRVPSGRTIGAATRLGALPARRGELGHHDPRRGLRGDGDLHPSVSLWTSCATRVPRRSRRSQRRSTDSRHL